MFSLNIFLEKFKNITPPDEAIRLLLAEMVKEETGIEVSKKNISIRNNIAYIKTTPIYKNEIYIQKGKIILKIKESFVGKNIIDIK